MKASQLFYGVLVCMTLSCLVFAEDVTLTLIWHTGICADKLLELAEEYEKETGVKVIGDLVPPGSQWHGNIAAGFAEQNGSFDLAAWDSQDIGEFAGGNHTLKLNAYIENSELVTLDTWLPKMRSRYGEYPDGSGDLHALPVNADALGMMYRKDLFEDPEEQADFAALYGYALKVPDTYQEMRDIAEFFTRPEDDLYGMAMFAGLEYDYCTSTANNFIWSFGGELWNPQTHAVKGYLDSPASLDGLNMYVEMLQFAPPGHETWGHEEVGFAFGSGRVAMAQQWFYFFGSMLDPAVSDVYDTTGFAVLPGAIGRDGKFRRQFSMGGQGLGISKYSRHADEAWKFLEWYQQRAQQERYAAVCQTGRADVLNDPAWLNKNPYNTYFLAAMDYTNDYWHLPEYGVLLEILQEEVHNIVILEKTPQEAMQAAAERQEQVLINAGYAIERTDPVEVPDTHITPAGHDNVIPIQVD